MGYQPFIIAPFHTGLDTDQEPWLLPVDAFKNILNGHIHHGYVEKRKGFRFLAEMIHARTITAATAVNPSVFTAASATGLSNDDSVTLQYLAGGSWPNLNGAKYTISSLAGSTFQLVDSTGTTVNGSGLGTYDASTGRLGTFDALRIMGIFRYIGSDNTRQTLIADTERVGIYNSATNLIDPLDLYDITVTLQPDSDVFASTNSDFIWAANWQHAGAVNRVYFTNGKAYASGTPGTDGILFYDAQNARVEQFQPALNSSDDLYGCKMMFSIKQRLLCLHTFEFNGSTTNTFPQRARWCAAQDPSNWNDTIAGGGGFVDAPTGQQIISATELQDVIIVHFTDSVWTLRSVPDPALPFRWDKINDFRACDGKMATIGFDRYSVAVGVRGITATDGVETRRVDERIEDFVNNDINDSEFDKVFAERSYATRRSWILYPSEESEDSNAVLIYDDESGAYSKYEIDLNALGYGSVAKDFAAQDFIAANSLDISSGEMTDETALSYFWSDTAEIFLGGDSTGKVYTLETETTDDGTIIPFSLTSAGWNPFKDQSSEAQFGYIDFFLESDQQTKLNISFYKNNNENSYVSQRLDLLPNLTFLASISNIVINSDPTSGFTVTANSHGLSVGQEFYIYGVEGAGFFNDELWTVGATVTENNFTVDTDITSLGNVITGISQATTAVVTATAHDLSDGDVITIVDVSGMVEVNGFTFTVAESTADTFELSGVDSTGFTGYTSGGYVFKKYLSGGQITERKFFRTKVWKRAYAGGIGYEHQIVITSEGKNQPFKIHSMKPWFRARGRRVLG